MSRESGRDGGLNFPASSLDGALPHLRRPPAPGAVRFKIQNVAENAAQIAPYVDARLVFDRLDHVCGSSWAAEFEELPAALRPDPKAATTGDEAPQIFVRCRLTVFGVARQDVGAGADPKAAFSDAMKRAAVHFGISRALYAMRLPWLQEGAGDGELRRNRKGKLWIDARTEGWCRAQYARWLERRGAGQFGEPLDHGDDPGAAGFEEERPEGAEAPPRSGDEAGATQDGRTAADGETVKGGLRAVSDGSPGEPPATALDRAKIAQWRQAGSYKDETVAALAGLVCGEKILERLSARQVRQVAWLLECALRGRVSQRTLAGATTRLSKREDRERAAEELEGYLHQKADEVGLLGRREAA